MCIIIPFYLFYLKVPQALRKEKTSDSRYLFKVPLCVYVYVCVLCVTSETGQWRGAGKNRIRRKEEVSKLQV